MQQGLVGETIGVGYRIDAELSGGNMGMVYRATQLSVDRRVALKVIDQDRALNSRSVDRFFHEARIISKLEHPHIVRLYDFGRDEPHDLLYLVMEYIDGPTLNELLRTHRFKQQLVVEIGMQICRALIESHAQNVVHRDLKPANILLSCMSDGSLQLKVVDFGVARALETLDKQLTAEGAICGTPRYMPPEQARHGGHIDGRADLYALGLILYEMLCGYPPFDAEDAIELIFKHIKEEPRALSTFLHPHELDQDLEALTHELLYKVPSKRPDDALIVLRRLEHIRAKLPGHASAIRLDGRDHIYAQLTPWMLPAVQEARASLVFGNTSQLGSQELDMEPLETEWDHTHTVRVDLNSIVNQETQPFRVPDAIAPLAWGAGQDDATIPPDPFDAYATQVTPSKHGATSPTSSLEPPPQAHFSGQSPLVARLATDALPELDTSHMSTLLEDEDSVESELTHIVQVPVTPAVPPPSLATIPSRYKTLSGTLQALFFKFSGARPADIAENTAENMFLNSSEDTLADLEAQQLAERATSERLLLPVMLAVVVCVIGVIGFVFWRVEQHPDASSEEVSRLDGTTSMEPLQEVQHEAPHGVTEEEDGLEFDEPEHGVMEGVEPEDDALIPDDPAPEDLPTPSLEKPEDVKPRVTPSSEVKKRRVKKIRKPPRKPKEKDDALLWLENH